MADYKLKITHLCVGLGLSVLIELDYMDTIQKHYVGLLDCGSITGGRKFYGPALEKIIEAVHCNNGYINYLHISHFDADHYNLLENLAKSYRRKYNTGIEVIKLCFGCVGNKDPEDIAKKMQIFFNVGDLYALTNVYCYPEGSIYSCTPSDQNCTCLYENINLGTDLYFRICPILYHAHLIPINQIQDEGVEINTGSSILLATIVEETGGTITPYVSYVFTGDATLETMKILLNKKLCFRQEPKLILVSHHGAKRHIADNEDNNNYDTLKCFLRTVGPSGAVVSAKCKNQVGWTHPHSDTIDAYLNFLLEIPNFSQKLTAFCWDAQEGMVVRQGTTNRMFYQTFRLSNEDIEDKTPYIKCNNSMYERIDVEMTSGSTDPENFSLDEKIR